VPPTHPVHVLLTLLVSQCLRCVFRHTVVLATGYEMLGWHDVCPCRGADFDTVLYWRTNPDAWNRPSVSVLYRIALISVVMYFRTCLFEKCNTLYFGAPNTHAISNIPLMTSQCWRVVGKSLQYYTVSHLQK